jgi:LysM repeat protein
MKRFLFLIICLPSFVTAQDKLLMVEGTSPGLYLDHTVAPKENFYSIGRLYNISPKEIAPFNKITMEKGLNPGQVLKIPLNKANFSQDGNVADGEVLVPLYYTVKEKEGLYRIGINHNKLPVETLKKWNKIKADAVNKGTNLIVGYLKVKKDQSAFASNAVSIKAAEKNVATENSPGKIPADEKKEDTKTVITEQPPAKNEDKEKNIATIEKKDTTNQEKENVPIVKPVTSLGTDFNGGIFKNLFESQTNGNQIIKEDGMAGVFKSSSGWKDGKYYCLHNNVAAGTVIKITNTATGKSVYAKVLDVMPDLKQNAGLLIRLSNAAADELGAGENNFNCTLNYSK